MMTETETKTLKAKLMLKQINLHKSSLWRTERIKAKQPFWATLLLLVLFITSANTYGQFTDSKDIKKLYKVTKETKVEINNKYGNIEIETWDKDSIAINIHVEVSEKTNAKLQVKLKEINFDISQNMNYVSVNTILSDSRNTISNELSKLKENIGIGDGSVQIDMKIKLPDYLDLSIGNKFGNIYLNDYNGSIGIEIANGKLKAYNLGGKVKLKMNFGEANFNFIENGNFDINYAKLKLKKAAKLRIDSKTSDIVIDEVGELIANSKRDDYQINVVTNFNSESSFSDFAINELKNKTSAKMTFGELTIDQVNMQFSTIYIESKSANINLVFNQSHNVNFEITSENTKIALPAGSEINKKEVVDEKTKRTIVVGKTGKNSSKLTQLTVNSISGEFSIKKR